MRLLTLAFGLAFLFSFHAVNAAENQTVLDHKVQSIEGETVDLSKYDGKVVLVVNVASKCGYTKQYADLEKLYRDYQDKGLVVLGFPCNQFGKQEPGSDQQILEFCKGKYDVTFPMFSKVEVNGDDAADLYKELKAVSTQPKESGEISWNFEKFLIGRDGEVIGRFASKVNPSDADFRKTIEEALAAKK